MTDHQSSGADSSNVLNDDMPTSGDRFGDGWKKILTPEEVGKAVVVDFEARTDGPQVILGVLTPDGDFTQYVMDPTFGSAADAKRKGSGPRSWCVVTSLESAVAATISIAKSSGGSIVGYTRHDLEVVFHDVPEYSSTWRDLYRDGKRTAKRWAADAHPDFQFDTRRRRGRYSLDQFLTLAGYPVPRIHGPGNTGQRLAYVRDQLERRGSYEALTPTAKGKWTNVLMHNYHDVHGLRHLIQRASAKLARP